MKDEFLGPPLKTFSDGAFARIEIDIRVTVTEQSPGYDGGATIADGWSDCRASDALPWEPTAPASVLELTEMKLGFLFRASQCARLPIRIARDRFVRRAEHEFGAFEAASALLLGLALTFASSLGSGAASAVGGERCPAKVCAGAARISETTGKPKSAAAYD